MAYHTGDTICAIASAAGGAVRGIVRVSGPDAVRIVAKRFMPAESVAVDRIQRATALAGRLRIETGDACDLPCDLFLWPTARSYTREPVVELHTIGSPPLLSSIVAQLCAAGARVAEPGEFTLRAFLAGRLDLTQAEAVLGVIDATDDAALDVALQQLAGGLAQPLYQLRDDLMQLLAELEAGLDFVEEDIRFIPVAEVVARLSAAAGQLDEVAKQLHSRHHAAAEQQLVFVGKPNAGKSSLFNALVERFGDTRNTRESGAVPALVSPQRGTTRDYLTATLMLDGAACQIIDTAGIESELLANHGDIESKAQHLSGEQQSRATIRAYCAATTDTIDVVELSRCDLVIWTKLDLGDVPPAASSVMTPSVVTSSVTGVGIDNLAITVRHLLETSAEAVGPSSVASTAQRCGASIDAAKVAVAKAAELAESSAGDELVAVEVRAALDEIGKVVGAIYTDDLLDRIFKTFCIGK